MNKVCGLAMLGCLLLASTARASDGEEIPLDKLPRQVIDAVNVFLFTRVELLHAWKEVEGGKECYVVRLMGNGRPCDLYVSPDGRLVARKKEVFSLAELPEQLTAVALWLLLPGVIAGALARWVTLAVAGDGGLPVPSEWLSAWFGAAIVIGLLLSNLATVPRHKDALVIGARCVVWGAISASVVEVLGLTVQSIRGRRVACRRWILGLCLVALGCLSLSIPVEMLCIERVNQYYRTLALRMPAGLP